MRLLNTEARQTELLPHDCGFSHALRMPKRQGTELLKLLIQLMWQPQICSLLRMQQSKIHFTRQSFI